MGIVFALDWHGLLAPGAVAELVVRGSLVYLSLLLLLRFLPNRLAGAGSVTDLLVVVLIAGAAHDALAPKYTSVTDGLVLVGTILFWNTVLAWLAYRFPLVERITHPPAVPLIKDGKLLRGNMRRQLITEELLLAHLRAYGVDDVAAVREARIEGDGRISVIPGGPHSGGAPERLVV